MTEPTEAALDAVLDRLEDEGIRLAMQDSAGIWHPQADRNIRPKFRAALPGWASPEMVAEIREAEYRLEDEPKW